MKKFSIYEFVKEDYRRYKEDKFNWFKFVRCYWDTLSETRLLSYIITYRISNYLYNNNSKFILHFFKIRLRKLQLKFGLEISYKTSIGKGLRISHGFGIVIHPNAIIGNNFTILQNCTIGNNINKSRNDVAIIGNDVTLGAGTKIIGPVKIEDNVTIGANAVVIHDIPSNCVCAGVPAKIIKMKGDK